MSYAFSSALVFGAVIPQVLYERAVGHFLLLEPQVALAMKSLSDMWKPMHASPLKTAKHGIFGLARTMVKGGAKYGVRSNVICPGFVMTPLALTGESIVVRHGWHMN